MKESHEECVGHMVRRGEGGLGFLHEVTKLALWKGIPTNLRVAEKRSGATAGRLAL